MYCFTCESQQVWICDLHTEAPYTEGLPLFLKHVPLLTQQLLVTILDIQFSSLGRRHEFMLWAMCSKYGSVVACLKWLAVVTGSCFRGFILKVN